MVVANVIGMLEDGCVTQQHVHTARRTSVRNLVSCDRRIQSIMPQSPLLAHRFIGLSIKPVCVAPGPYFSTHWHKEAC